MAVEANGAKSCWPNVKGIGSDLVDVGKQTWAIYNNRIYTLVKDCPLQSLIIEIGIVATTAIAWFSLGAFSLIPGVGLARYLLWAACGVLPATYAHIRIKKNEDIQALMKNWTEEMKVVRTWTAYATSFIIPPSTGDSGKPGRQLLHPSTWFKRS